MTLLPERASLDARPAVWARFFARAGARHVVMVTRHLDGYPLWPTMIANPHMPAAYRSQRDLVGDLVQAVREQGLRMGLYYGGGMDWTSVADRVVNDRWTQVRVPGNRIVRALCLRYVILALKATARLGRELPRPPTTCGFRHPRGHLAMHRS